MILTLSEITDILKNRPGAKRMEKGREYMRRLRMHLYGERLADYLTKIDGYERDHVRSLRAKYAKSNKDLFARLTRPVDKVFTAKGGSVYYNLSDQQQSRAITVAQRLSGPYSVKSWLQTHWKAHLMDDPFGLIFLEILPQQKAVQAKREGKSFVYPTYKPVDVIFDYATDGDKVDWVIFNLGAEDKKAMGLSEGTFFRVVDDAFDYIVRWENDSAAPVPSLTLQNYFGQVPAVLNSDIADPAHSGYVLSLIDEALELAEQFLLKGSIKVVHDFLHGFPKYSEFASECSACHGSGFMNGSTCQECKGSGNRPVTRVEDVKLLPFPESGQPVVLPRDTGGYVTPDRNYHDISKADMADLEAAMHLTLWGSQPRIQTTGLSGGDSDGSARTATEIISDLQPQADRLVQISEMAERRHKFILDAVVRLNLSLPNYQGASVNYGRRYLLESPDALWMKYSDARAKGAPQNVLDTLLNEYYEANYASDPIGLSVAKKLMYVEPFVHMTAAQVRDLKPGEQEYKAKLYFSEWLAQINEAQLFAQDVNQLREDLVSYSSNKQIAAA